MKTPDKNNFRQNEKSSGPSQDEISGLSASELEELKSAHDALVFLEQVRADIKLQVRTDSDSKDVNADLLAYSQQSRISKLGDGPQAHISTATGFETLSTAIESTVVGTKLGRFEVLETLGQGGFARVFLAYDPTLDRKIALKIPKPQCLASEEARRRFEREARAAALLSHPAIVPVFESGEFGPITYIASGYCPGETLAGWFSHRDRKVDCRTAAAIVCRLADAVEHAHQRGVVHRDLKPANILVEDGQVEITDQLRITDFGLARQIDSDDESLTMEGAIIGTPAYMSPEQAGGFGTIGPGADIYALGVIFYELLTAQLPFRKSNHLATLKAVESEAVPAPRKINDLIPRDLQAICLKCLNKASSERYPSAFELSNDLNAFLENRPVKARPVSQFRKLSQWYARNTALASALVFAFVCLAIGLGVSSWQWNRSNGEARRASIHLSNMTSAIDLLLEEIGSKDEPSLITDAQKKLLNEVLLLQKGLIDERDQETVSKSRLSAMSRASKIYAALGQHDDGLVVFEDARSLFNQGSFLEPENDDRQLVELIADVYFMGIENLNRTNQGTQAIEVVDEIEAVFEANSHLFNSAERKSYELSILHYRGQALLNSDRLKEATAAHQMAAVLGNELDAMGRFDDDGPIIAANLVNFAGCLRQMDQLEESSRVSEESINVLNRQLSKDPRSYQARRLLAIARKNWSYCLSTLKQNDESERQLQLAIGIFEELLKEVPGNSRYAESLSKSYVQLAYRYASHDAQKGIDLVEQAIQLSDQGLTSTLVGKAGLVQAYRVKSNLLLAQRKLDEASEAAEQGVKLADEFFANATGLHGQIPRLNAWGQLMNVTDQRNDAQKFVEDVPLFRAVLNSRLKSETSPDRLPTMHQLKAWCFRREAKYLSMTGKYHEAIQAVKSLHEINWHKGSKAGMKRHLDCARTMSEALYYWHKSDEPPTEEFDAARELALDWLEYEIRELGFKDNENLFDKELWEPLRIHERYGEILAAMNE